MNKCEFIVHTNFTVKSDVLIMVSHIALNSTNWTNAIKYPGKEIINLGLPLMSSETVSVPK